MALPRPSATLSVEGVSATPPGVQRFVVQDVAFSLKAGNGLGIIGPSASGKSSLARLLVGVWPPLRGKVRLDGAAFEQWDTGGARQAYRLSAAGRGAVRRHRGREHRPLRAGARRRGDHRGGEGRRRARADPAPAGRLRHPDRRGRHRALGRPAPARRAGPRALRRSVPGRARRAELQPRRRGRAGADAGDPAACARAAASSS